MKILYKSIDGHIFEDEKECRMHEDLFNQHDSAMKRINNLLHDIKHKVIPSKDVVYDFNNELTFPCNFKMIQNITFRVQIVNTGIKY